LGYFESANLKRIHRGDHRMNRVLVNKVLVKVAMTTIIVVGASAVFDSTLHVVNAWPLPLGALPQPVFPGDDAVSFVAHGVAHCLIKNALLAAVAVAANFLSDDSRLHPDTVIFLPGGLCFH